MIKQVRRLLDLFITKMTNVYFLQIIKLNREAMVKYVYLSFSRLFDCLFCDGGRHFEYDTSRELVVTYIYSPIFVQSLILLFVHMLYVKPLINFLKIKTSFFYH